MDWLILFLVSWVIFILLVDWKSLKVNIWCGLLAIALQQIIDTQALHHDFYDVRNYYVSIMGSSLLFIIGPVFTIGTLLAQYHPRTRKLRIINVFALGLLYSLQELLLLVRGDVIYNNWHYIDSVQINISVMIILSWFTMMVLKKEECK